jgi:hypothetical protein
MKPKTILIITMALMAIAIIFPPFGVRLGTAYSDFKKFDFILSGDGFFFINWTMLLAIEISLILLGSIAYLVTNKKCPI